MCVSVEHVCKFLLGVLHGISNGIKMIQCNIWLWSYQGLNLDWKCMKIQQVLLFTNQSPIGCQVF